MKPITIAIIGCGAASQRYYVPALEKYRTDIEEVYFVDPNTENAEGLKRDLGWGRVSNDYHAVLDKVQGAIVVVPHFLHYQIVMDLLNAGVHVLCEKPLAESSEQAREMIKTATARNVALCVNNTRRMFPSFQAVQGLIASGELGRPVSIEYREGNTFAWPSATGFYVNPAVSSKGVLLDIGPHVLDVLCWWLGKKPDLVEYADDSFGGPESVARIRARADGCTIDVMINRLTDLANTYKVICEHGSIDGKIFDWGVLTVHRESGKKSARKLKTSVRNYPGFVEQVFENFIRVVQGTEKPAVTGGDVMGSIELIQECYDQRTRLDLPSYNLQEIKSAVGSANPVPSDRGKVLVTGATGFIGGRVVEVLHLSGARDVRAGIRQWSSAARLGRFPVDIVTMDLMNREQIERALDGITEVIHCAKGNYEVTVDGTKNLLECALKKGIRRFVHLSTADVYGDVSGTIDENQPMQYTGNEYNKMKIDAEKVCWEYRDKGLPVTVIRPSIVYGPFSRNWTIRFAMMLLAGEMGLYEKFGEGKCNLIYIDDLVRSILVAATNENAVGQAFNVKGPDIVTWNDYFKRYNDMLDLPPLRIIKSSSAGMKTAIMEPVRKLGGFVRDNFMGPVKMVAEHIEIADILMRKIEHSLKTTPSPDELKLFNKDVIFSSEKADTSLGIDPSIGINQGLKTTVMWLRDQGVL